jgi:hypothetical protein
VGAGALLAKVDHGHLAVVATHVCIQTKEGREIEREREREREKERWR